MEREPTPGERGILEFMLADPALPAGDALRAQIPHVHVVDGIPAMPTYLHLAVTPGVPSADCRDGLVPVHAVVVSDAGETTGFILVWTEAGYLATVEHAWVTDDMPEQFPSPDQLRVVDPQSGRIVRGEPSPTD